MKVVFNESCLQQKLSSTKVVFSESCLQGKLSSTKVVFNESCLQQKLTIQGCGYLILVAEKTLSQIGEGWWLDQLKLSLEFLKFVGVGSWIN